MPLKPRQLCCRQPQLCHQVSQQKDALCQRPPSDILGVHLVQVTQVLPRTSCRRVCKGAVLPLKEVQEGVLEGAGSGC